MRPKPIDRELKSIDNSSSSSRNNSNNKNHNNNIRRRKIVEQDNILENKISIMRLVTSYSTYESMYAYVCVCVCECMNTILSMGYWFNDLYWTHLPTVPTTQTIRTCLQLYFTFTNTIVSAAAAEMMIFSLLLRHSICIHMLQF